MNQPRPLRMRTAQLVNRSTRRDLFADMPDCPFCRYGTPVECKDYWLFIDCGAKMSKAQIIHNNSPI